MPSPFGIRLRKYREAKGMTLQQVADQIGCTRAWIWDLEMKPKAKPTVERVKELARVLEVSIQDLLGEPVASVENPSPEDVMFFREYSGLDEDSKRRLREAMKVLFGKGD